MLKNIRQIENVVPSQHQQFQQLLLSSTGSHGGCCKPPPYSPLDPPPPLISTVTPPPAYDWIYRGSGGVMPPLLRQQQGGSDAGSMQPLVGGGGAGGRICGEQEAQEDVQKIKCVLVGDGAVGKTSLIVSYTTNGYPTEYVPTAFDNYSVVVTVDNKPVRLQLCDTAGQDDFDSLRPLCYPGSDVFLVCFSVVSPTSFHNAKEKWLPELRQHQPAAPVLLVGTQSDLRTDVKVLIELAQDREQPVSEAAAQRFARQIGAYAYVESSALTQRNLKEVFDQALLAALDAKSNPPLLNNGGRRAAADGAATKKTTGGLSCTGDGGCSDDEGSSTGSLRRGRKAGWRRLCCFV